jgi:hypothetical protein
MDSIPDFSNTEMWILETTLKERYRKKIPFEVAEAEIRLSLADRELTICPTLYWEVDSCNFVIFKVGENRYQSQFFYRVHQQFGTDIKHYEDLTECIVTLLQTQADYLAQETETTE